MNIKRLGKSRRAGYLASQQAYWEHSGIINSLADLRPESKAVSKRLSRTVPLAPAEKRLGRLLTDQGSDKATFHDYDEVYENLFTDPSSIDVMIEIGIGSHNLAISSAMGDRGHAQGGSCRAFLEWGVRHLLAADIDETCMSKFEPYETFLVDQRRNSTFGELVHRVRRLGGADFIVVDGLHTFEADANSIVNLLPTLKLGGVLVVEDIEGSDTMLELWRDATNIISEEFQIEILNRRNAHLVVIERANKRM